MARNWKRIYPSTVIEALRLCKDHALDKKRLSVERIAELMGVSADALYKWLSTGRMPTSLLPAYEHVCGIDLVSRYLATSAGRLVIDMPKGHTPDAASMQELQTVLNKAVGALLDFYSSGDDVAKTTEAVLAGIEQLSFHKQNIQQVDTPQLDLLEQQI